MRLSITPLLLLLATTILAQDRTGDAASGADPTPVVPDTSSGDNGANNGGSGNGGMPANGGGAGGNNDSGGGKQNEYENVNDPTRPWNVTYFTYPTRNNYWVNDNENKATWVPVNVATNLMLAHGNASILPQRIMLQQNIAPGVGTFSTRITGYTPANNYLLVLSVAGNPDQKLAQSQGFYIKANGTAAPQQVTPQGVQATATAVSDGGSTQPGSGAGGNVQPGNGGGGAPAPSPPAQGGGQHSGAIRICDAGVALIFAGVAPLLVVLMPVVLA